MVRFQKFILVPLILALLLAILVGCVKEPTPAGPFQRLLISGEIVEEIIDPVTGKLSENYATPISVEDMGGNYTTHIGCTKIYNLTITLNGSDYPLADAIRDQLITVEEICAYARIDARTGFCTELADSNKGLSRFHYIYPNFELSIAYDIYETPDGRQHTINTINFYPPGGHTGTSFSYTDPDAPYPYQDKLDREDWGLTLDALEVTPNGVLLKATQTGGQQIGQLQVLGYELFSIDQWNFIFPTNERIGEYMPKIDLAMSSESEFSIDWAEYYSELAPGKYYIVLYIKDIFQPGDVHPLMVDYYTTQEYFVEFTVN